MRAVQGASADMHMGGGFSEFGGNVAGKGKASKKRGSKDMDVPLAGPSGKEEAEAKKADRKKAQEAKKVVTESVKIATWAAKCLGPLTQAETSLTKVIAKGETVPEAEQEALTLCQESLLTAKRWIRAAKDAVSLQDRNKEKGEDAQEALTTLPCDAADVKVLLKQITEAQKHISKSKCTKHLSVGPLLEVEMSKKCTPWWREAHFEVKMFKTPGVRTNFGGSDVEKVHAVVARSTFRGQNVQNTRGSDHFWRFRCRSLRFTTIYYIALHYTTLHYTSLHHTTLHSTTLQLQLHNYTLLHSTTLHNSPLH